MRVLNVYQGNDTAGCGYRTAQAFRRLAPDWQYRTACTKQNYLRYPVDMDYDPERVAQEWARADVVHMHNMFGYRQHPQVPIVMHHHGRYFRRRRDKLLRKQRALNVIGLAAALDLYVMAPDDLEWVPFIHDIDELQSMRRPRDDGVLRIGHAPTVRKVKSTETFLAAAAKLGKETPVEVVLIERKRWAECLKLKATVDVLFDQVLLGYGNNAVEAWGMGIPVVAGGADDTLQEMVDRFGSLPFVQADEATIYDALASLAEPASRSMWGARGLDHARRFHSYEAVVPILQDVYRRAVDG